MKNGLSLGSVLVALAVLHSAAGCNTDIDPIQETDRYYSVFGYLDASADTQFVRVSPLRTIREASPDPLDVEAVLENLETGETSVLRDSVFTFGEGGLAHNFWTTMPIGLGDDYRLTVRGPEGRVSTVEMIRIPPEVPLLEVQSGFTPKPAVILRRVDRLAAARLIYYAITSSGRLRAFRVDYEEEALRFEYTDPDGNRKPAYTFLSDPQTDLSAMATALGSDAQLVRIDLFAASGGPGWPDVLTVDDETLSLPDFNSNVENGIGYVGGIVSASRAF